MFKINCMHYSEKNTAGGLYVQITILCIREKKKK